MAIELKFDLPWLDLGKGNNKGCRNSSVDSSAPSILLPQVRVPSKPSTLFSIYIVQTVYLPIEFECEKNENKHRRGRDWPFFKKNKSNWGKLTFNS